LNLLLVVVLLAAIVFAALAGRLAAGRGRSQPAWTMFGAILGPIALILLLVSPPGRCPTCGMRTRGWPSACADCGLPFGGLPSTLSGAAASTAIATTSSSAPISVPTVSPDMAVRSIPARPLAGDQLAAPVPAAMNAQRRPSGAPISSPLPLPPTPSRPQGRRRPGSSRDRLGPDAIVVATGVFITGSARMRTSVSALKIGERYGIAKTAAEIQILGPVYVDPERIIARVPAPGAVASLEGDRLVVVWPSDVGATLAFSGLSIPAGMDPAGRLTDVAADPDRAVGS
jgi:hypothetical protein